MLLSGFAVLGALSGRADDVVPSHFTFDRYARMLDHPLFAVVSAVALPEATLDFAKHLYVANAARRLRAIWPQSWRVRTKNSKNT